jgi:4-carboxymuconolactone decarboxylase
MGRQTRRAYKDMSPEQQEVFDSIARGRNGVSDGHIGGPFDAWILNAEMGKRIVGLGGLFRFRTQTDRRYIELAILMVGRFWEAQFEWYAHAPMAKEAGLPDDIIAAIKLGEMPTFSDAGDEAAWRICSELLTTHEVSEPTYRAGVAAFGEQGVAEIVNVAGYYTMVSMTLNTFRVPLPEGAEYPFERKG